MLYEVITGFKDQSIISGKISSLLKIDFGAPPHTIIITGKLHFTETDALKILANCIDEPSNNSDRTIKIASQMMQKYRNNFV